MPVSSASQRRPWLRVGLCALFEKVAACNSPEGCFCILRLAIKGLDSFTLVQSLPVLELRDSLHPGSFVAATRDLKDCPNHVFT